MKLGQVKVGGIYWCKVSGVVRPVQIVQINHYSRRMKVVGRNLVTGRLIYCTARRLRRELTPEEYKRIQQSCDRG